MAWITVFLVLLVLAAVSAGVALGLHLFVPGWSPARRALTAASIAIGLPMSIAFAGFFFGAEVSDGAEDYVLGLLALIMLTLVLVAVIGLPSAWLTTGRLGRAKGGSAVIADAQTPEAIAAEPSA